MVVEALRDWPQFDAALRAAFGQLPPKPANEPPAQTADAAFQVDREGVIIPNALNDGRVALGKGRWAEALDSFGEARRVMSVFNRDTGRWYARAHYGIVSNRARCAAALGDWGLVRMDSKFALAMNPGHMDTYGRMPGIATAHCCPELVPKMNDLLKKTKEGEHSPEEWRTFSQMGSVLLSLSTIIAARTGNLTEEFLEKRIQLGVEDMFEPLALPAEARPGLPWLSDDDQIVLKL
jgi:hypothetical protein